MGQGYKPATEIHPNHQHLQQLEHQQQLGEAAAAQDVNGELGQVQGQAGGGAALLRPERRSKPHPSQLLKCPRCDSLDTKFCYYNNYSLAQPRYFCKNCKRYWTAGGALRNVPVGGGLRKNKRSKMSASSKLTSPHPPPPITAPPPANPLLQPHFHHRDQLQQQPAGSSSSLSASPSASEIAPAFHHRLQQHLSVDHSSSPAPALIHGAGMSSYAAADNTSARNVPHPYYNYPLQQFANASPLGEGAAAPAAGYALNNYTFLPSAPPPHPPQGSSHLMIMSSPPYPNREFDQFRAAMDHHSTAPSIDHAKPSNPKQEPASCEDAPASGNVPANPPYDWHAISEGLFGPNTGDFFYMPGGSNWPDFNDPSAGPG